MQSKMPQHWHYIHQDLASPPRERPAEGWSVAERAVTGFWRQATDHRSIALSVLAGVICGAIPPKKAAGLTLFHVKHKRG